MYVEADIQIEDNDNCTIGWRPVPGPCESWLRIDYGDIILEMHIATARKLLQALTNYLGKEET